MQPMIIVAGATLALQSQTKKADIIWYKIYYEKLVKNPSKNRGIFCLRISINAFCHNFS